MTTCTRQCTDVQRVSVTLEGKGVPNAGAITRTVDRKIVSNSSVWESVMYSSFSRFFLMSGSPFSCLLISSSQLIRFLALSKIDFASARRRKRRGDNSASPRPEKKSDTRTIRSIADRCVVFWCSARGNSKVSGRIRHVIGWAPWNVRRFKVKQGEGEGKWIGQTLGNPLEYFATRRGLEQEQSRHGHHFRHRRDEYSSLTKRDRFQESPEKAAACVALSAGCGYR